jgi:hypothetical protein
MIASRTTALVFVEHYGSAAGQASLDPRTRGIRRENRCAEDVVRDVDGTSFVAVKPRRVGRPREEVGQGAGHGGSVRARFMIAGM